MREVLVYTQMLILAKRRGHAYRWWEGQSRTEVRHCHCAYWLSSLICIGSNGCSCSKGRYIPPGGGSFRTPSSVNGLCLAEPSTFKIISSTTSTSGPFLIAFLPAPPTYVLLTCAVLGEYGYDHSNGLASHSQHPLLVLSRALDFWKRPWTS